jgi:hypothetical protein
MGDDMLADLMTIHLLDGIEIHVCQDRKVLLFETTEDCLEPEAQDITQSEVGQLWLRFAGTNKLSASFVNVGFDR